MAMVLGSLSDINKIRGHAFYIFVFSASSVLCYKCFCSIALRESLLCLMGFTSTLSYRPQVLEFDFVSSYLMISFWKGISLCFKDFSEEKNYLNIKRTNELATHQVMDGSKQIFDKNCFFAVRNGSGFFPRSYAWLY